MQPSEIKSYNSVVNSETFNPKKRSRLLFSISLLMLTSSLIVEDKSIRIGCATASLVTASIGIYIGTRKPK